MNHYLLVIYLTWVCLITTCQNERVDMVKRHPSTRSDSVRQRKSTQSGREHQSESESQGYPQLSRSRRAMQTLRPLPGDRAGLCSA